MASDRDNNKNKPINAAPQEAFKIAEFLLDQDEPSEVDAIFRDLRKVDGTLQMHVANILEESIKMKIWDEFRDLASPSRYTVLESAANFDVDGNEKALLRAQSLAHIFFNIEWTKGEATHPFVKTYARDLKALPEHAFQSCSGLAEAMINAVDKTNALLQTQKTQPAPAKFSRKKGGSFDL